MHDRASNRSYKEQLHGRLLRKYRQAAQLRPCSLCQEWSDATEKNDNNVALTTKLKFLSNISITISLKYKENVAKLEKRYILCAIHFLSVPLRHFLNYLFFLEFIPLKCINKNCTISTRLNVLVLINLWNITFYRYYILMRNAMLMLHRCS